MFSLCNRYVDCWKRFVVFQHKITSINAKIIKIKHYTTPFSEPSNGCIFNAFSKFNRRRWTLLQVTPVISSNHFINHRKLVPINVTVSKHSLQTSWFVVGTGCNDFLYNCILYHIVGYTNGKIARALNPRQVQLSLNTTTSI